jgi:hypothetical protein
MNALNVVRSLQVWWTELPGPVGMPGGCVRSPHLQGPYYIQQVYNVLQTLDDEISTSNHTAQQCILVSYSQHL